MTSQFKIYKLDANGQEKWSYPGTVLEQGENYIRLEAYFDQDESNLGVAVLERGDRFVETFYSDRWYNIFAVYSKEDDSFKGWYCNVCRPAEITEDAVRCDDLALDVWVNQKGQSKVMDENEFVALDLSDWERQQAREALQTLLTLANTGNLPA